MAAFDADTPTLAKRVALRSKPQAMWWDGLAHPLTDDQFVLEFCRHVFNTTDDRSLATVRNRAFRFIRTFMAPELERQLTLYRTDHA